MHWSFLVAIVSALLLSGCLTVGPIEPESAQECRTNPGVLSELPQDDSHRVTEASQAWDALLFAGAPDRLETMGATGPAGWTGRVESLSNATDPGHLVRVRFTPEPGAPASGRFAVSGSGVATWNPPTGPDGFSCEYHFTTNTTWTTSHPSIGATAAPGKGTHVWTAGFWENGTLFYTNMPSVEHSSWPRAGWYEPDASGPLPVYVYDKDRSERSPLWSPGSALPPPLTGTVSPWNYYTTIQGFNEALKGLSTNTVRVVRLAPEEGYTYAGANPSHPLYGDALVFYIKLDAVVDVPCPPPLPVGSCNLPQP